MNFGKEEQMENWDVKSLKASLQSWLCSNYLWQVAPHVVILSEALRGEISLSLRSPPVCVVAFDT